MKRKGKGWDHARHIVKVPNTENCDFLKSMIFQWRDVTKLMPFGKVIIPTQIPSKTMENHEFPENGKIGNA